MGKQKVWADASPPLEEKQKPTKPGAGWRRVFIVIAVLWLPITLLLSPFVNAVDPYGEPALLFFFAGEAIWIALVFLAPWIVRGFGGKD